MNWAERIARDDRLTGSYFDRLYERDEDPWRFESSPYEKAKYEATLDALGSPERRFGRAFEAGCSIGVFTELLAGRCDDLLAVDLSPIAVERAKERLRGRDHVKVEQRALPEELPDGPFDLVVCSEILYYWSAGLLERSLGDLERADWSGRQPRGGALAATYPQLPTAGRRGSRPSEPRARSSRARAIGDRAALPARPLGPAGVRQAELVIVGGGAAGLSAARGYRRRRR